MPLVSPLPCPFYLAVYSTIVSHHVKSLLCFVKRTAYLLRVCVLFATISPEYDKTGFSVSFLVLSYRNAENFILQLSITNTRRNYHERRRNPKLTLIPFVPQNPLVKLYLESISMASSPTIASVWDLNSPPSR